MAVPFLSADREDSGVRSVSPKMEQTMPNEEIFEVRALICDRSNRFDPFTEHLEKEEPIMGSAG